MNITTLSTYPIEAPRHGGQHRLHNIADQYRRAGHTVRSAGVLGGKHYPLADGFVPYPGTEALLPYIENPFLMDDWAIGELFAIDEAYFSSLASQIPAGTQLLHVEQPWLFRFAQRYIAEVASTPIRLLYGSQNVEHELKRRIVATYLHADHAETCARLVLACEVNALQSADLCCAVLAEDADWMQTLSAVPVVLAPNGVREIQADMQDIRAANSLTGHSKFALYCASAHPPNIVGFFELFRGGIGCLAPEERLVIAGGAGHAILSHPDFTKTPGLARHLITTGEVDESCLNGLLGTAHAIVLPITQGGGTNLKTAEALWAAHYVIATQAAMRGFDQFNEASGVAIANEACGFRTALRDAMMQPALALSAPEQKSREVVLWKQTMKALVHAVGAVALPSKQ